jgi:hypothetical protein
MGWKKGDILPELYTPLYILQDFILSYYVLEEEQFSECTSLWIVLYFTVRNREGTVKNLSGTLINNFVFHFHLENGRLKEKKPKSKTKKTRN